VPLRSWPEDSCSLPLNTIKSFSRLYGLQSAVLRAFGQTKTYRISKRANVFFLDTEVKGLNDFIARLRVHEERPSEQDGRWRLLSDKLILWSVSLKFRSIQRAVSYNENWPQTARSGTVGKLMWMIVSSRLMALLGALTRVKIGG